MQKQMNAIAILLLTGATLALSGGLANAQAPSPAPAAAPPAVHKKVAAPAKAPAKPQAAAGSSASYEIIPCGDSTGKIHKCIRIDPAAGEINDSAKGASYRVIFGQ